MIKIITDSSANLPDKLKYDLTVIPYTYILENGEAKSACENFDGREFYSLMRKGEKITTSMINTETFKEYFERELKAGNDIIYIGMSGGISGSMNAAGNAIEELDYPERKAEVIDTFAASLGEGLLVIAAAEMLKNGKSFEEICAFIKSERNKVCQYFTVDDLEYLKRGGRISGARALVGNLLDIKPILTGDEEGHIVACGKVRGRNRALRELAKKYASLVQEKSAPIGIAHADAPESALELIELLKEEGFTGDALTVCYEPVTGAHVGPGTVALFFIGIHK